MKKKRALLVGCFVAYIATMLGLAVFVLGLLNASILPPWAVPVFDCIKQVRIAPSLVLLVLAVVTFALQGAILTLGQQCYGSGDESAK